MFKITRVVENVGHMEGTSMTYLETNMALSLKKSCHVVG